MSLLTMPTETVLRSQTSLTCGSPCLAETVRDFTINDADRDTATTTLYVRRVDGSLSDDVRLLCMDGRYSARCHIPELVHLSVRPSVCLSQQQHCVFDV